MIEQDQSIDVSGKRVALVTGSATGIGANIALDLAASGHYFVIVTGRNAASMQRVVAQCNRAIDSGEQSAGNAVAFRADLSNHEQLEELVRFVKCKFGLIHVLVNNACWRGQFPDPIQADNDSYADFKRVMHINVSVPMYLIHKCLIQPRLRMPELSDGRQSSIESIVINISSIASQVAVPLHSYSISKACLSELSKQLAESANDLGILSVTISPGPVLTDERPHHQSMSNLTLMNRVGTTQEISNLVLFALSNAKLFNGMELNIDGGYLAKHKGPPARVINLLPDRDDGQIKDGAGGDHQVTENA